MNHDIDQDWPADADNAELRRLAEQLAQAAPPLPADALARVQQQIQAEMDRAGRWQRLRRLALGCSIAAGILVAVVSYLALRDGPRPQLARQAEPSPVEDRLTIAVGAAGNADAAGKPLIALDENRSLLRIEFAQTPRRLRCTSLVALRC